jgi:hypothetical protein
MRAAFVPANRRLDLTPNQGLSWPVRLRSSPHNDIGLVGEGLPLLLPRRGEATGQTTEMVIIVQVSRIGFSCSPRVALLASELRGLRGGDQSEIVFSVLKIVFGCDRVVAGVCVARQLKVSFRHMLRRAANSDVRAVRVIRTSQGVGFATAICLAAASSVILTKWHFLSLGFNRSHWERVGASAEWRRSGRRSTAPSSLDKTHKRDAERVVSDLVRRSVRFGPPISCKTCAPSGRRIGLSANNCASTAAASRNAVDLRSLTPRP